MFTEPLSSNDRGIHVQTQGLMGGINEVRCWDELIPSFIKIGSGIRKLMGQTTWWPHKPTFIYKGELCNNTRALAEAHKKRGKAVWENYL
jgi:hypothetical protein